METQGSNDVIEIRRPASLARTPRVAALLGVALLTIVACAPTTAPASSQTTAPSGAAALSASPTPSRTASPTPSPKSLGSVKIAVTQAGSAIPLTVGVEKGFYAREGLTVEVVEMASGGAATQALIAGQVPIAGFSVSSTLDFYLRGEKLVNLVLLQDRPITQIVTRKELGIKPGDWASLRGKKIGTSGPGGATDTLFRLLLLNMGWDPDRDVQIIATGGLATQQAALQSGQVDVQVTFEPAFSQWTLPGALNIANTFLDMRADDAPAPLPTLPQSSIAAKADYVKNNPAIAHAVARGTACAIKAIRSDPSLARAAWVKVFPGLSQAVYDNIVKLEVKVFSAEITRAQIESTSAVYKKIGTLKETVPYEAVVSTDFAADWACK